MIDRQRRRIRRQSVLLSSYRRNDRDWGNWLNFEILKPVFLLAGLAALHVAGLIAIPLWLVLGMMAASAVWALFVVVNAWAAFQRMDRRRLVLLEAAGVVCDLSAVLQDKRLWSATLQGRTMRDMLKDPSLVRHAPEPPSGN
ncbi:MAG TPA: hypothetical protein VLG14_08030 [Sphingomonas sp.]|jgi:hypothetical protein|nr:hypothetical protein [Sphingomonas sp.]